MDQLIKVGDRARLSGKRVHRRIRVSQQESWRIFTDPTKEPARGFSMLGNDVRIRAPGTGYRCITNLEARANTAIHAHDYAAALKNIDEGTIVWNERTTQVFPIEESFQILCRRLSEGLPERIDRGPLVARTVPSIRILGTILHLTMNLAERHMLGRPRWQVAHLGLQS